MSCVFGPVPSNRLGRSLGIDPIELKTCNWNCVYCQLGRTVPLTNQRRAYRPLQSMLDEIEAALQGLAPESLDWITIVGSGEPLLHAEIGALITGIKAISSLPLAVITNGGLLYEPAVRSALLPAEAVLPSVDAGSAELFRTINRPHPDISFERYADGLVAFREEYQGKYWPEVMLMKDINDDTDALQDIARLLAKMRPDRVHLNTPTRPPAETWVEPTDEEGFMRARAIFGDVATAVHPAVSMPAPGVIDDVPNSILDIITRHPMRPKELGLILGGLEEAVIQSALDQLKSQELAKTVERLGKHFWIAMDTHFPTDERSQRVKPKKHS